MKLFHYPLLIALGIGYCSCEYGTEIAPEGIRIANFPDDREAGLSFTFDDNTPSSFTTIAPLFKEFGFSATFFVIPGRITNGEWEAWRGLSEAGFEIGNHTLNHPDLQSIKDPTQLDDEIDSAYHIIENKIGKAPFSFAHPYHRTNDTVDQIVFRKHFASRLSPQGFCRWWGIVSESTEKMFDHEMDKVRKDHEWFVVSAHGINDGWSPMKQSLLEHALHFAQKNKQAICTETFGNLAKYKLERMNTKIHVLEQPGKITISLECDLDKTVFNYPLTLVVNNLLYAQGTVTALPGAEIFTINHKDDRLLVTLKPFGRIEIAR